MKKALESRFWAKVEPAQCVHLGFEAPCWVWVGSHIPEGYGALWVDGQQLGAHRVSWELHRGEIPKGLCVLHKCDNRSCVNPDHLFLGTKLDNIRDAKEKGRNARGASHGSAKLTDDDVVSIRRRRAAGESGKKLAAAFGVSDTMIYKIASHKAWQHVKEL